MSVEVLMPRLGFTMEEGDLVEWLVPDGTRVEAGQPLYTLESEKAVQEVESPASGTVRILAAVGETYAVGACLAVID